MTFDFANLRLSHKIAMLVLGITLFVGAAIGMMSDWMLRSIQTQIAQGRAPSVAALEKMTGAGGSVIASRIVLPDGSVGILLTQASADAAVIPAVLTQDSASAGAPVVLASSQVSEDVTEISAMRTKLLLTCVAVLGLGALLGFAAAGSFTEPLGKVIGDLNRLAKGDTNIAVGGGNRTDEIGEISRATLALRKSIVELNDLRRSRSLRPSGADLWSSLRAQWHATKQLFIEEWRVFSSPFRMGGVSSYRAKPTYDPSWKTLQSRLIGYPDLPYRRS